MIGGFTTDLISTLLQKPGPNHPRAIIIKDFPLSFGLNSYRLKNRPYQF